MRRQTLIILSVLLLFATIGLNATELGTASASETSAYGEMLMNEGGNHAPPLAGEGDDDDGPATSLDSGDDDDYWSGIQGDDGASQKDRLFMLRLILEHWMETNNWLFH